MRRMSQRNVNLGVFQEAKVTGGIFARESIGYCVTATSVLIPHHSDVAVFYHEAEHFYLEVLCIHSLNVVRFKMVKVWQRWHVLRCYIAPDDASTIEYAVTAINKQP